jgi:hypothetical protein
MLVDACGGCGAPHAGFARVPVAGVIMTGHGYSPLKTLLAPLVAAFDAFLGVVSGDVGRCPLIAARCRLPASWWRAKHDYLIAGGALDGGTAQLLKCALEEVAMSILPQALCAVLGQRTCATLASMATNLGLIASSLPLP